MKNLLTLLLLVTHLVSKETNFKNGDIIFQDSPSSQSRAIKLATHSKYSHVGIIFIKNKNVYFYEAVGPVVFTPIKKWISNGVKDKYVLMRLKDDTVLTKNRLAKMKKVAKSFEHRPYDALFGWSDNRIYCSELVWKIYKRGLGIELGKLKKLKSFDLSHPFVKRKLKERYGNKIPLNEKVIAPQGIFKSNMLIKINFN